MTSQIRRRSSLLGRMKPSASTVFLSCSVLLHPAPELELRHPRGRVRDVTLSKSLFIYRALSVLKKHVRGISSSPSTSTSTSEVFPSINRAGRLQWKQIHSHSGARPCLIRLGPTCETLVGGKKKKKERLIFSMRRILPSQGPAAAVTCS